ncbi:hypothetical protein [Dactylosporangium sp. CA-139066]|uniref:hypothetical protein n=1 Tax=Dactylosporangium sp. CA-139066 TaxID=3239930 RepID=UPI003D94B6CF
MSTNRARWAAVAAAVVAPAALAALLAGSASGRPSADPSPSMTPPSPYPSPVVSGPGALVVDCAAILRYNVGGPFGDTPGDLVPFGAKTVTRCDTALDAPSAGSAARPRPTLAPPEALTTNVDSFVQLLNTLPSVAPDQACLHIAFPTQLSFVFIFDPAAERWPLVVVVDRNCAALVANDGADTRARSYATLDPMPIFEKLFAAQPPA